MLVLASSSPRRMMLLQEWGYQFQCINPLANEDLPEGVPLETGIRIVAERKAEAGVLLWEQNGGVAGDVVVGADTMVVLNGQALGKPATRGEAEQMLERLSGVTHQVLTGVALRSLSGEVESAVIETKVRFRVLSRKEIQAYVASGEPMDKAGAYAIQGEAREFVESFQGSLTNVIGLPMEYLSERLKARGI